VFNEQRGIDARSAFIVDGEGKLRWSKTYEPGTIPESAELLAQLRQL
jgi:hypothetical protein